MITVSPVDRCMYAFQASAVLAFSLNDLSSSAETAKSAAEGASLLDRAKSVYTGFYDSTENLVDAQTVTMSLLNPDEGAALTSQLGDINSAPPSPDLPSL